MKYLGTIQDPKDLITKEYVDDADTALSTRINANEDNIAMAESDIESLQTDTGALKTDMSAVKGAVATLQDTYVPNTRKVNGKALSADITLTAGNVGTVPATWTKINDDVEKLVISGSSLGGDIELGFLNGEDGYYYGQYQRNAYIKTLYNGSIEVSAEPITDMGIVNKKFLESKLDIFWARYDVTAYSEVVNAFNAGKKVLFSDNHELTGLSVLPIDNSFAFITFKPDRMILFLLSPDNVWNAEEIPISPVTSVNNKTGAVELTASDVGAIAKVSPATEGNIPVLTTSGELTDSGKNISDIGIIAVFDSTTYEEIKEAYENNTPVICFYNANLTAGGKVEYRLHALTDETAIFVGMESVYPDLTVDFLLCSSSSEWTVDYAYLLPAAATEHKGDILMVNDVGDWQITDPPFLNAKVVTNISCPLSAWVSDTTTYTDYQFKANLTVAGATANYIPLVNFAPTEQESGNYIGATSGNGIVTIWCKNKPSGAITIPNIILTKEN